MFRRPIYWLIECIEIAGNGNNRLITGSCICTITTKSAKKAAPPVVNASASEAKMEEKISTLKELKEQVALQQKQLAELRLQVAKMSLPAEIPSKWTPREPLKESAHGFFGRKQALENIKKYVMGVKNSEPYVKSDKGHKFFTTVGTMGIGKTVCVGVWQLLLKV